MALNVSALRLPFAVPPWIQRNMAREATECVKCGASIDDATWATAGDPSDARRVLSEFVFQHRHLEASSTVVLSTGGGGQYNNFPQPSWFSPWLAGSSYTATSTAADDGGLAQAPLVQPSETSKPAAQLPPVVKLDHKRQINWDEGGQDT